MAALVDTNVLLRLAQPSHPHAAIAERTLNLLHGQGEVFYVASQNLIEFWVVATRSTAENGLGFSPEQASTEISQIKGIFKLLPELSSSRLMGTDSDAISSRWEKQHTTRDSSLVMKANGIAKLVTFNTGDLGRYDGIQAVDPRVI